jgi:hypothetical protein
MKEYINSSERFFFGIVERETVNKEKEWHKMKTWPNKPTAIFFLIFSYFPNT